VRDTHSNADTDTYCDGIAYAFGNPNADANSNPMHG